MGELYLFILQHGPVITSAVREIALRKCGSGEIKMCDKYQSVLYYHFARVCSRKSTSFRVAGISANKHASWIRGRGTLGVYVSS